MSGVGKVLFLTRDRGSAQTLSPVIKVMLGRAATRLEVVVPAVSASVLVEQGIPFRLLDEAEFAKNPKSCIATILDEVKPDLVVSGSSPARGPLPETPEQYLILMARRRGIPSLAVLDFWGMYAERFLSNSGRVDPELMPDRLCVLDSRSRDDMIALGAPEARLVVTHNPWMDTVVEMADSPPPSSPLLEGYDLRILFVSQPYAETRAVRGWPFSQRDLLQGLLEALPRPRHGKRHLVLIWPHPAENRESWHELDTPATRDMVVRQTAERGAGILAHVDLVVSGHSTVIYEALHLGTPSVSYRPGSTALPPQVVEELDLVPLFDNWERLRAFLAEYDAEEARAGLQRARHRLVQNGLFFSDGQATDRVVAEIGKLLPGVGICPVSC